ncbi:uncharacterized protein LOC113222464 [Piliocolobus tephrosceles]|uniref:uncharacterized protein LOC113222464 n=1 Tax=Piliocolobus tephrosceles TaxID=591936 RepID=UPI000E6B1263|nr:uncharacterized protein LOC113222464 [Piliocolobus tephrosceles]
MKKCIKFMIHVNAMLQLDFFYFLNEPPLNKQHQYSLMMAIEARFRVWMMNQATAFNLSSFDEDDLTHFTYNHTHKGPYISSKLQWWTAQIKTMFQDAFDNIFNQKHYKTLLKNYDSYNISNKIMLMKDTYELFLKNYENIYFTGDIMLLSKFFDTTPKIKIKKDRQHYIYKNTFGNAVNYYKCGIIYGYTINKLLIKEVVDELFTIYKLNQHKFTEIIFMQTVRLLFKEIQKSFFSHRRNDKISMNNLFFFNIRNDYSKLNPEQRQNEINYAMASRFYEKTMFSIFHIMFIIKISRHLDKLDQLYGKATMMHYSVHEKPYVYFKHIYHNSLQDIALNVFFPMYIKKPVTQLKYGKTFVFAYMLKLTSELFSIYNLNNLSLLCQYQAVITANFYAFKKVAAYIDRLFVPMVIFFFFFKIKVELDEAGKDFLPTYLSRFEGSKSLITITNILIYVGGNILYQNALFFPNHLSYELRKQAPEIPHMIPSDKPQAHYIDGNIIFGVVHSLSVTFILATLMRWYSFMDNILFMFRVTFRIFDRYYEIINDLLCLFFRRIFNKMSANIFLKALAKIYLESQKAGYFEEVKQSRLYAKTFTEDKVTYKQFSQRNNNLLQFVDIENQVQKGLLSYNDKHSYFNDLEESEEFLNDKSLTYYEDQVNNIISP